MSDQEDIMNKHTYECDACGYGVCKLIVDGDLPDQCVYDAGPVPEWKEVEDAS